MACELYGTECKNSCILVDLARQQASYPIGSGPNTWTREGLVLALKNIESMAATGGCEQSDLVETTCEKLISDLK